MSGYSDGTYLSARYGYPNYITRDALGNLYVSDHFYDKSDNAFDSIRRLSTTNLIVTTMAGKTGI